MTRVKNSNHIIFIAVTALGISSVITQISITRELLNIFSGNELVIGFIISIWLIITGLGALSAGHLKYERKILVISLLLIAVLPFVHIIVLRYFRNIIAERGSLIDIRNLFIYLPVILFPYCFISGYLLPLASGLFEEKSKADVGKVYFFDNIGDILGGLIFSFCLVFITTTFNSLYLPAIISIISVLLILWYYKYKKSFALILAVLILLIFSLNYNIDKISISWLYPYQKIIAIKESIYGRIVITEDREQINIFDNGIPYASTKNILNAEEIVHPAMCQIDKDKDKDISVLLISGGITGVIDEILKYNIKSIDYVELDPEIIKTGKKYFSNLNNNKVNIFAVDGRKYIEESNKKYDAVIIVLPAPSNIQINRFYTEEFYKTLDKKLNRGGIITFSLPGYDNYINRELSDIYSSSYYTSKKVFKNIKLYPLGKTVFVLSNPLKDSRGLTYDIGDLIKNKNIKTKYINSYYLNGIFTKDRIGQIKESVKPVKNINRDLFPTELKRQIEYWMTIYDFNIKWIILILLILSSYFLVWYKREKSVIWTTGFAGISLEIIILLLFEIESGYIYYKYSLILTLFMIGLSIGSYYANNKIKNSLKPKSVLLKLEIIFISIIIISYLVLNFTELWKNEFILYISVLAVSVIMGAEFSVSSILNEKELYAHKIASSLYTADFIGSGLGSLFSSIFFIPVLGVINTILILIMIKFIGLFKLLK